MSTDTAGVLAAIDRAVRDWETSGDAMRWNPAPREARGEPEQVIPLMLEDGQGNPLPGTLTLMSRDYCAIAADDTAAIQAAISAAASRGGYWAPGPGWFAIGKLTCPECAGHWRRARCTACHPRAFPGPVLGVKPSLPAGRRHARKRKWR